MPLLDVNHYNLRVPHAQQASLIAFYTEVLGFEYRELPYGERKLYWLWVAGRPLVHLTFTDAAAAPGAERVDHVAFSCSDLPGMRAHLAARGVPHTEKHYAQMGFTQIVLQDPVGLKIELNFADD